MFKTVLTLFRGSLAAAEEELEDRSALLILDQQMRDAAAAVSTPPTPGSPISKSAPPQHSMAAGKISPARPHRRSPISRLTATPR
jgi:hypothetical protein